MLFKEKLYLANCDSVQKRQEAELIKRIKTGLLLSEGIIIGTNILIDNKGIDQILFEPVINEYLLSSEGVGKLVVRARGEEVYQPLEELYHTLPETFVFSSFGGVFKKDLSAIQKEEILFRLKRIDQLIHNAHAQKQPISSFSNNTLAKELEKRIPNYQKTFQMNEQLDILTPYFQALLSVRSRSEAYNLTDISIKDAFLNNKLKYELIDPAYNKLFVRDSEGFVQDQIEVFDKLPSIIVDSGISLRKHREKIELIQNLWEGFEFISSLGSTSLIEILTDKAQDYIESTLEERGLKHFSRKNWYGMYGKMANMMGVEIK